MAENVAKPGAMAGTPGAGATASDFGNTTTYTGTESLAGVSAAEPETGADARGNTSEARSRFNAALEEARAGVAALGSEARERASDYSTQARQKGGTLAGDAKSKAGELAIEGKTKASEALAGLAKLIGDNAATLDDKLGAGYGDYARSASQSLHDTATRLDDKSVEELGEDARTFVRNSPAAAVGLAALAGFMVARILRK